MRFAWFWTATLVANLFIHPAWSAGTSQPSSSRCEGFFATERAPNGFFARAKQFVRSSVRRDLERRAADDFEYLDFIFQEYKRDPLSMNWNFAPFLLKISARLNGLADVIAQREEEASDPFELQRDYLLYAFGLGQLESLVDEPPSIQRLEALEKAMEISGSISPFQKIRPFNQGILSTRISISGQMNLAIAKLWYGNALAELSSDALFRRTEARSVDKSFYEDAKIAVSSWREASRIFAASAPDPRAFELGQDVDRRLSAFIGSTLTEAKKIGLDGLPFDHTDWLIAVLRAKPRREDRYSLRHALELNDALLALGFGFFSDEARQARDFAEQASSPPGRRPETEDIHPLFRRALQRENVRLDSRSLRISDLEKPILFSYADADLGEAIFSP